MTDEVKKEKSERALMAGSEEATLLPVPFSVSIWCSVHWTFWHLLRHLCLFTRAWQTHTPTNTIYIYRHYTQAQHDGLQSGHRWPSCSVELNSAVIASDDNVINHDILGRDGRKEQRCLIKVTELKIIHEALKQPNLNSLEPWIKNTLLPDSRNIPAPKPSKNSTMTSGLKSSIKKCDKYLLVTSMALRELLRPHKLGMRLMEERNVLRLWNCSRIMGVIFWNMYGMII